MKFVITLLTLVGASAFAQESTVEKILAPVYFKQETSVETPSKNAFTYVRMGASPVQGVGAIPGIGVGYRLSSGSGAVDLSANFGARHQKHGVKATTYTFPKANYLHYFNPTEVNSLYVGGGLAWGGIHKGTSEDEFGYSTKSDFDGIIANAALGYEMQRTSAFRSFVQLDVNQPMLAVSQKHAFPSPSAELGVGIGF